MPKFGEAFTIYQGIYHLPRHLPSTEASTIYRGIYHLPSTEASTIYRGIYHLPRHLPSTEASTICGMAEEDDDASKTLSYLVGQDSSVLSPEGQDIDRAIDESNMGLSDIEENPVEDLPPPLTDNRNQEIDSESDDDEVDDDEEELEVVAQPAADKNIIQEAKSLLVLSDFPPPASNRRKQSSSATYGYYWKGKIKDEASLKKMLDLDSIAHGKLTGDKEVNVCMLCFNDVTCKLSKCCKAHGQRGPGNLQTHLKTVHGIDADGKESENNLRSPSKIRRSGTSSTASTAASSRPPAPLFDKKRQKPMSGIFIPKSKKPQVDKVFQEYQILLHEFVTNNNISQRAVTDRSNCPEFHKLIKFVIHHA